MTNANASGRTYPIEVQAQTASEVAVTVHGAGYDTEPGFSAGTAAVGLFLPPGTERLADSLIGRFGDRLAIDIAGRPYLPPGCGTMPWGGLCPTVADGSAATTEGLTARLVLDGSEFRQDGMLSGQLIVENHGARALAMYGSGSGLTPMVYDPAKPGVVGMFNGGLTADLHTYSLGVDGVVRLGVLLNGARCGGANGENSMPPGDYRVRAGVAFVEPIDPTVPMNEVFGAPVVATATAEATVRIVPT